MRFSDFRSQWRKLELALKFINKSKKSINQKKNNMSKSQTMDNSMKRETKNYTNVKKCDTVNLNLKDSINVNHFYNQNENQFYGCIHKNMIIGENHDVENKHSKVRFI